MEMLNETQKFEQIYPKRLLIDHYYLLIDLETMMKRKNSRYSNSVSIYSS